MKTERTSELKKLRKPYVKPQIEKVHLRTNETMNIKCYSTSIQLNQNTANYCEPPFPDCRDPRS